MRMRMVKGDGHSATLCAHGVVRTGGVRDVR